MKPTRVRLVLLASASFILSAGAQAKAPAGFTFEGWIGEGRPVFTAAQTGTAKLHLNRSTGSEGAGVCALTPGDKLTFRSSFVVTTRPFKIVVAEELQRRVTSWGHTRALSPAQYYGQGTKKTLGFPIGSSVEFLMPRAEGACLFRARGEVFQASCDAFPGVRTPYGAAFEWWLQVECGQATGWMLMDVTTRGLLKESRSL